MKGGRGGLGNSNFATPTQQVPEYAQPGEDGFEGWKNIELKVLADVGLVEEWMKSNELAVERGIKGEIAEDFITGLKKLFEDHYINVPDEKYDVLEDQASKIEELNKKLNEQIDANVKLNSEIGKLTRQDIVDAVSKDLPDTNKEKFNKLAEEIEYSNADEFKKKVTTIKESYFSTKEISSKNEIDIVLKFGDKSVMLLLLSIPHNWVKSLITFETIS